jgi:hypothetical protein
MAQTIWTQAATAIMTALNAIGAPATFYRARFEAVGNTETAGNLYPTKIDCKYECAQDSVKIDATMVVRANIAATSEVDLAADPLVQWAWTQIRRDPTLGQLVEDVYVDNIEIGYVDKSASDQVCVDMTIRVEVEVGRNDPSINKTYGSQL